MPPFAVTTVIPLQGFNLDFEIKFSLTIVPPDPVSRRILTGVLLTTPSNKITPLVFTECAFKGMADVLQPASNSLKRQMRRVAPR